MVPHRAPGRTRAMMERKLQDHLSFLPLGWKYPAITQSHCWFPRGAFACLDIPEFPSQHRALLCSPPQSTSAPFSLCHRKWECGIKKKKKRTMELSEGIPWFQSWSCSLCTLSGASHHNGFSCSVTIFWSPDSAERLSPLQTYPCISEITLPARSGQSTASQGIPDTRGCSVL